jgi:hypothetical protein
LILDSPTAPSYEEILAYIQEPARSLWSDLNTYLQTAYKASPKIAYSKCSGKPGWNLKYQKSGKSLCTLYPEKRQFIALVVVALDLVPLLETSELHEVIRDLLKTAKPFNGTKWLMVPVQSESILMSLKQVLDLKFETQRSMPRVKPVSRERV